MICLLDRTNDPHQGMAYPKKIHMVHQLNLVSVFSQLQPNLAGEDNADFAEAVSRGQPKSQNSLDQLDFTFYVT